MGFLDFINQLFLHPNSLDGMKYKINEDELDIIYPKQAISNPSEFAKNNPLFALQLGYLKSLQENYDIAQNANGVSIPMEFIPELGEEFHQLFRLPTYFDGSYQAVIQGNSRQSAFEVRLELHMADGSIVSNYKLIGGFLKLTDKEQYSLHPAEYQALKALEFHKNLSPSEKTEFENNFLIFQLQLAKKSGMKIYLAHFEQERIEIITPEEIGVALNTLPNGDVELIPAIEGISPIDIRSRLGQLQNAGRNILKVKGKFVLFTEDRLKALDEIFPVDDIGTRRIRYIKKNEVEHFLANPTAYLDAALINLDTGFSLRVLGAEKFTHKYFGDIEKSGMDWFGRQINSIFSPQKLEELIQSEHELEDVKERIENAQSIGASTITFKGVDIDISDTDTTENILNGIKRKLVSPNTNPIDVPKPRKETAVVGIKDNDEENKFERHIHILSKCSNIDFDKQNLKRLPFPHQQDGIQWVLSHLSASQEQQIESGALLADDMGLGKTYMTLVSVAEYYRQCELQNRLKKPVLIVAPLSLLENWKAELEETFYSSPFSDLVILQGNGLKPFKLGGREIKQNVDDEQILNSEEIRYSLKVGKEYHHQRLDMPARLVLTTYQTLRDYQFSLCRIDWSIVIFDEAQNLKNPNALVTRAAKGLKSEFKLLATGTPVENSLKDFWCLMDTATPGLLGSWQEFRKNYIQPILSAEPENSADIKLTIGQELRNLVGEFMLRRTKAEKLDGLPEKITYTGLPTDKNYLSGLDAEMTGWQLTKYDEVIHSVRDSSVEDKRSLVLKSLRDLRMISIHPNLMDIDGQILKKAMQSSKLAAVMKILEEIQRRNEKVLLFTESKIVQAYLVALLAAKFGISVEIINGETSAVATKTNSETRKSIIDKFQSQEGFAVLVMSPIAAGVGLTIVGANNVIHLERHWNPAKEAQATDRVYRIGQKRTVNVYLPMAVHPKVPSFDFQLHTLLENKIDLSNAIVANPDVSPEDLAGIFAC